MWGSNDSFELKKMGLWRKQIFEPKMGPGGRSEAHRSTQSTPKKLGCPAMMAETNLDDVSEKLILGQKTACWPKDLLFIKVIQSYLMI